MPDTDSPPDIDAFFVRDGEQLIPTRWSKGPWAAGTLHGRVIAGALGVEIERRHGEPELTPARLVVDMYRAPSMAPLEIVTRVVRDGKRIRLVDAELISEGKAAGRASCEFLRRSANPPGEIWGGETWDAPVPKDIPQSDDRWVTAGGVWDMRPIEGGFDRGGRRKAWMREVRPLIAGEPLTPFGRVAACVDIASPMAHASDQGLAYINSDVAVYLHRLPKGEWIGFETMGQDASDGVAIGHCNVYDEAGRIGWAAACALAQSRS